MNRKVSILIPAYNREEFIEECIQSALDQSYDDFEVIVVDNASEDSTWAICQKFAAEDPRVKIFRNKANIGPVKNWQRCAQEAKGELSKILFSDDLLEPDCLKEMVASWGDEDIGFVFCAAKVGPNQGDTRPLYASNGNALIKAKRYSAMVLNGKAPVSPGAVMLRTTDLKENLRVSFPTAIPHNFENNGAGPDLMIMLLTALKYEFVKYLDKELVFFRAHSGSFTVGDASTSVRNNYEFINSYYLHQHDSWMNWIMFLSFCFIRKCFSHGRFLSPRLFLKEREGEGKFYEVAMLFLLVPVVISKSVSRRILKAFKDYS